MTIDLFKLIPQPNLQTPFDASELLAQVSAQPLKENLSVVHAISVPTACQMFPLRENKPRCSQCNRFL